MPGEKLESSSRPFLNIVGGNLVQTVDSQTQGARLREYELASGTCGKKWEMVYMNWTSVVTGIRFKNTDYGEMCIFELGDANLSTNTESRYFSDLACKLCGADLKHAITFHPYDMEVDGKRKTGVSMKQGGEKLTSHFYDGKENLHGFPVPDMSKRDNKRYWKTYFAEVTDFLVEELKKLEFPEQKPKEVEQDNLSEFDEDVAPLPDEENPNLEPPNEA